MRLSCTRGPKFYPHCRLLLFSQRQWWWIQDFTGRQSQRGPTYYWPIFPENYMKMKKFCTLRPTSKSLMTTLSTLQLLYQPLWLYLFIAGFIAYLAMEHDLYVPPGQKWYCRIYPLVIFVSFLCSTLFVLSMTFDRFYSIIMPHKAASFNTVKRAKITVGCSVGVSITYNLPHLFLTSNVNWECVPYGNVKGSPLGEVYYWLSAVVQFVIPFILLLIMNSVIIHKIRNRFLLLKEPSRDSSIRDSNPGENSRTKNSELQVFAILLSVAFAFLILTTPAYIFFPLCNVYWLLRKSETFRGILSIL